MIWPNFSHPGRASYQRGAADKFDPYPSPDTGPEILGGRPLGYTRPYTETEWGRRYATPDRAPQPAIIPTLPGPAPVITAPPPVIVTPAPVAPSLPANSFPTQQRAPY
jgi:hypothetical protein